MELHKLKISNDEFNIELLVMPYVYFMILLPLVEKERYD